MICPRCQTNCNDNVTYCPRCGNKLQTNDAVDNDATQYVNSISLNSGNDEVTEYLQSNIANNHNINDDDVTEYLDPATSLIEQNNSETVLLNNKGKKSNKHTNQADISSNHSDDVKKSKAPIFLGAVLGLLIVALIVIILFL
ncbi:MAG: hypothetical protein LUG94_00665 [Ruminococcus sp.]|nr:hypothetical protein [Ruminococcus sp.]